MNAYAVRAIDAAGTETLLRTAAHSADIAVTKAAVLLGTGYLVTHVALVGASCWTEIDGGIAA
jgi:hypothetical protein